MAESGVILVDEGSVKGSLSLDKGTLQPRGKRGAWPHAQVLMVPNYYRMMFLPTWKVPLLHETWGGKEKNIIAFSRGTARLLSVRAIPCPTPEPWWHPGLCERLGTMKFGAENLKMCLWEDDAWEVGF